MREGEKITYENKAVAMLRIPQYLSLCFSTNVPAMNSHSLTEQSSLPVTRYRPLLDMLMHVCFPPEPGQTVKHANRRSL